MLRRSLLITVLACLAVPLAAQQKPDGWKVRVDRSQNAQDPDDNPQLQFRTAAQGLHVTGGPAGVFWNPANTAAGAYTLKGNFTLVKPSSHPNYYGLVFGGAALDGAAQSYIYFVVAQNGTYLIKHREGEATHDIKAATPHDAVKKPDASGRSTNALEVRVAANEISYLVNGVVVHTTPKSGYTAKTDGFAGFRVNHVLDVQVDGFTVQRS